ncbi:glycosyltransferase [Methanosarcina sp. Z-7115]|uniref:Glycosyltransferase n=1 Tax=Methanosarcina baikalica TaxID=3073890 RepID=A0ABU2D260_9EURY|nr:glycosyltransferase [Methanosarcina sp. Z-7115]MDR7666075.1 glycosyltransferase [Methanosarcina sp. Z-7115]
MSLKKKILFTCHSYNNFQKDPIDLVSSNFDTVSVLVRYNPIAEFSRYIPLPFLNRYNLSYKIDLKNKPSNLNVYPTPVLYASFDSKDRRLGEKNFKAAEKVIEQNNIEFDIIHSHFTWSSGYVGAKLSKKYDVPFVVTAHGYDIYDLPFRDKAWRKSIEDVLNDANCILTVSKSNLDCINELDVESPVKIISNGYRSDLFYPKDPNACKNSLNLPTNKKIILSVGNLETIKGHKYLIESVSEVVKWRKDILCVIVGGGKLWKKLNQQIKKNNLDKYVLLTGEKPHDEIPIWMNACDVFVLPSIRESFGVVQIEAMACKKPIVATHNGGSGGILISEDYGFLVEPENSAELAKMILLALNKNWNADKIYTYSKKFALDNIKHELISIYNNL